MPDFEEFAQINEQALARIWWIYDPPPPYLLRHIEVADQVRLHAAALKAKIAVSRVQQELVNQQLEILDKYM